MIPQIPEQARIGFSRDLSAYRIAVDYWTRLLQPIVDEAHLTAPWLTGGPQPHDISGSTIFSAASLETKRGFIVDQQDGDLVRDEIGWFFNSWGPDGEDVQCLQIHCFLGPRVAETTLSLARLWFIDMLPEANLVDKFSTTYVG